MPIDQQSGKLTVKQRDQVRDEWLRNFKNRVPTANITKDSYEFIVASTDADAMMPLYANAGYIADGTSFTTARGQLLTDYAAKMNRPRRPAVGARGYVIIEAATGGGEILAGTELRYQAKGARFKVSTTATYLPGDLCAIEGISLGSQTNLPKDTQLTWLTPPIGILGTCKVFENTDGSGLTGGAPEETDEDLIAALVRKFSEPASSGNDAAVIDFIEELKGIAIQKAFCFPCLGGPGQYSIAFTMRPDSPGASRLPNSAHIAFVEAQVKDAFPADDGISALELVDHDIYPILKVRWKTGASGFADMAPWPAYSSPAPTVLSGGANPVATASSCRVTDASGAPSVGNTIAFYDSTAKTFKQKRILTSTLSGADYDLTFDLTGNASDRTFVPSDGALVSPWSVEMSSLVAPLLAYVDKQGVGEMVATLYDAGRRQRRIPLPDPSTWPSAISNSILDDVFPLVADAVLASPTTPAATTVGAGPLCYLHRIADIAIYAI
jgi:uncharacterized phage protein gp47/JayE